MASGNGRSLRDFVSVWRLLCTGEVVGRCADFTKCISVNACVALARDFSDIKGLGPLYPEDLISSESLAAQSPYSFS